MKAAAILTLLLPLATAGVMGEDREDTPRRQCFWASQVTGFTPTDRTHVLVNINRVAAWELTLSPGCSNPDWALSIGIVSRGSQRICSGRDAELLVPRASGTSVQRCLVRSVRRLSPAEVQAARAYDKGDAPR